MRSGNQVPQGRATAGLFSLRMLLVVKSVHWLPTWLCKNGCGFDGQLRFDSVGRMRPLTEGARELPTWLLYFISRRMRPLIWGLVNARKVTENHGWRKDVPLD